MAQFEIESHVVYSYKNDYTTVVASSEEEACLAFYRMRIVDWKAVPAYGQLRPRSMTRLERDDAGRVHRTPVKLPDWVWDRPDELSKDHPLCV